VNLIDVLSQDVNIECNFYQLVRAKNKSWRDVILLIIIEIIS